MAPKNPPATTAFGQLLELIGEERALRLARLMGGRSYAFPRQAPREGPLITALGEVMARKVCHVFGGECIYIPKLAAASHAARNQAIVRAYLAGTPARELSVQFGITERRIWSILKGTPVAAPPNMEITKIGRTHDGGPRAEAGDRGLGGRTAPHRFAFDPGDDAQ